MMTMRGDVLIIFTTIFLPVSFIITYFMATSNDHVEKEFPYISDTGTYPPESCVFGLLLVIYSISTFLTVHARWEIVRFHQAEQGRVQCINKLAFVVGALAALGVLIVATFQETSVIVVHVFGAFLAFGVGAFYMWLQSYISYCALSVPGWKRGLCHIRLILAILTTCCFILTGTLASISEGEKPANDTRTSDPGTGKWASDMNGYDIHIASTSFEWALAGLTSLFFLSFIREYRHIHIGLPSISFSSFKHSQTLPGNQVTGSYNSGYGEYSGGVEASTEASTEISTVNNILQGKEYTPYQNGLESSTRSHSSYYVTTSGNYNPT